jgi:hypothetical protein
MATQGVAEEAVMEADMQNRLGALKQEIHRLESSLAQSPDDAFGYLELGCLFAEADQREEAITAFRQSYAHRTGGLDVTTTAMPVVDEQFQEAFDVAVAQAPAMSRGRTRELFEIAVQKEQRAETQPVSRLIVGVGLLVIMSLAAFGSVVPNQGTAGYWPTYATMQELSDVPSAGGYWPSPKGGW